MEHLVNLLTTGDDRSYVTNKVTVLTDIIPSV